MTTNKILMVRNAYAHDFGGGERLPVDIAEELDKHGISVTVVSRSPKLLSYAESKNVRWIKGWWWSRQDWSGARIILLPIYITWQLLLYFWYLALIIRTSASIVHLQSRDDFIAGTLAAKTLRKRVFWSDYADLKYVYQNNKVWYKNPIGKAVLKLSKHADKVIITSKSDLSLIEQSLGRKAPLNHQVVYMGVSSKAVEVKARQPEDKDLIIFGATSRLVKAKGIAELIEAFGNLTSKHEKARLWLFGEGPDEAEFKKQADSNERIVFWGYPDDTLSWLASCDVFVHPSYHEGFSISLLEAAKLGLPIIACDVGGNPELVKDNFNGLLIKPKNASELQNAMEQLIDDHELRSLLGENSKKTFEENFVFEEIIKKEFVPLYEK